MDHPPTGPTGGDEFRRSEAVLEDGAAAPRRRVGIGFVAVYVFAYIGMWMALLTPVTVSLALKVQQVAPANEAGSLSLVLGVGAFFALVANPFFGKLSDRTTSRFGMRRPWLLGGAVVGTLGLLLVAIAQSVPVILVGWCLAQLAFNALLAAIVALLPDQVPVEQRGRVSGALGMALPFGLVAGTFLAQAVSGSIFLMFLLPAAVCVVTVIILCAIVNDRRLDPSHRPPPYRLKEFLGSFWVNPVRHPDFGWAWASRFFVVMGYATLISFQVFYLTDHLSIAQDRVAQIVFVATLILQGGVVAVSILSGWLSDRLGRRKIFVLGSAATYALALAIIAFAGSLNTFYIGMAIAGLGLGVYLAVDLALVADVLPDPDNAAKDLGVFNIANAMPQSIAPAIAPIFLAVSLFASGEGDNYTALYFAAGVFALLGALAIRPVKGVR